jgi:type VI secretion system protein ImpJ
MDLTFFLLKSALEVVSSRFCGRQSPSYRLKLLSSSLEPAHRCIENLKLNRYDMSRDGKQVVWFEGMTLDPHHFQQWDRHRDRVLRDRLRAVTPDGWGLTRLQIDEERLANGSLAVEACAGVMPDGLVVDVPGASPVPEARDVQEHVPATDDTVRVCLAVPADRADGRNVQRRGSDQDRTPRFVAERAAVVDENTGDTERPVEVAHPNVELRFADEPQQGYSTLPIAEVERTAAGFALSDTFVPPCLALGASDRLTELTGALLERLVAKSGELADYRDEALAQRELTPSEVTSLGALGTLNAFIPRLRQYHADAQSHPRALFRTLTALAGRLSTYVEDAPVAPRDLPVYDHADPTDAFVRVEQVLRTLLGDSAPSADYQRIPLDRTRENLLEASVEASVLTDAQLFLVVRSDDHPESQLTDTLPEMLRVASPGTIDDVLQSYTQALSVTPTRRLPANMPVDNQATYFKMEKRGPFWDAIQEEEGVAVFVPSEFQDVDVDLMAAP